MGDEIATMRRPSTTLETLSRPSRAACIVRLATGVLLAATVALPATPAHAQGWWPWASQEPPRPREPVYRPPPAPIPGQNGPGLQPPPGQILRSPGQVSNLCLQLEQRMVAEGQRGGSTRELLPKIETAMREADREAKRAQSQLERGECFEFFLFSKSLRNTPSCRAAAGQSEAWKRKLAELDIQRQQIMGTSERSNQDEIVRELARNGCGQQYVTEARRRDAQGGFSSLWSTEEEAGPRTGNQFGTLPFATYRTICVRLCDGYYFPVSFSTLPNHFVRDQDLCQSRCAAPVDLYYHQNPGGAVEQAMSAKNQTPYTQLKTAFRYRKEYVQGCSCKEAEYLPAAGEKKADAGSNPSGTALSAAPPVRQPARQP